MHTVSFVQSASFSGATAGCFVRNNPNAASIMAAPNTARVCNEIQRFIHPHSTTQKTKAVLSDGLINLCKVIKDLRRKVQGLQGFKCLLARLRNFVSNVAFGRERNDRFLR